MGHRRQRIACPALQQLVRRMGRVEAARGLGCSPSGLSDYLASGESVVSVELAARHLNSKADKSARSDRFALVRIPADKAAVFETLMNGAGFEYRNFDFE